MFLSIFLWGDRTNLWIIISSLNTFNFLPMPLQIAAWGISWRPCQFIVNQSHD